MYPVARIYSLIDVTATEGGLELRLGLDPGGGVVGSFRYVPLINGVPDIDNESSDIFRAYTSGGFMELVGRRPNIIFHQATGFRSSAQDQYLLPDLDSTLAPITTSSLGSVGAVGSLGMGLFVWSKGRFLEWRGPDPQRNSGDAGAVLPRMRVLYGKASDAPSLPKALEAQLTKSWFVVDTLTAFRTGEVIAVGRLHAGTGFGTLLWKDDLEQPRYIVTESVNVNDESELEILGGTSLADVRLRVDDKVLRLDGAALVVESTMTKGGLPDVWFGSPLVRSTEKGTFARLEKGAPWRPIPVGGEQTGDQGPSFAVDASGVIWKTEGDFLYASKQPSGPLLELTEHDIVQRRKASILRGGYGDETGAPPQAMPPPKCRMRYVLLDRSPLGEEAPTDYPRVRAALKGHPEFSKVRFVVSREKKTQFFGGLVADDDTATGLKALAKKRLKPSTVSKLCAEPVVVREIKINLATGAVIP
jgi:hypothetical protein